MANENREIPKFDQKAWEKAYQQAEDLPPEPVDFSDPEQIRDLLQNAMANAGLTGRIMAGKEVKDFWEQERCNFQNLILAELGDDTVVEITDKEGEKHHLNINERSWRVYINIALGYKRKGDLESANKLTQIFPSRSQLQAELEARIEAEPINRGYKGFDIIQDRKMGKVDTVIRGNQYDLLPGTVDFREFVNDGQLNVDAISNALFEKIAALETVYDEDWGEINRTMDNIRKEFREETANNVWEKFRTRYQEHISPDSSS